MFVTVCRQRPGSARFPGCHYTDNKQHIVQLMEGCPGRVPLTLCGIASVNDDFQLSNRGAVDAVPGRAAIASSSLRVPIKVSWLVTSLP